MYAKIHHIVYGYHILKIENNEHEKVCIAFTIENVSAGEGRHRRGSALKFIFLIYKIEEHT